MTDPSVETKEGLPVSDEAIQAAHAAMARGYVAGARYADLMAQAIQAFLTAEGFEIERGDVPHPTHGWNHPDEQYRLVSPWKPYS